MEFHQNKYVHKESELIGSNQSWVLVKQIRKEQAMENLTVNVAPAYYLDTYEGKIPVGYKFWYYDGKNHVSAVIHQTDGHFAVTTPWCDETGCQECFEGDTLDDILDQVADQMLDLGLVENLGWAIHRDMETFVTDSEL
jgi:hypothetical protein